MEQRFTIEVTPNESVPPKIGSYSILSELLLQIADNMNKGMILTKIVAQVDMITPIGIDPMPTGNTQRTCDGTEVFIPDTNQRIRSFLLDYLPSFVGPENVCDPSNPAGWFHGLVNLFTSLDQSLSKRDITVSNLNDLFTKMEVRYRICICEDGVILFKCDHQGNVVL